MKKGFDEFDTIDPYYGYDRFKDKDDSPEPFLSYEDAMLISDQLKDKAERILEEGNKLYHAKKALDERRELYDRLDKDLVERETRADVIQDSATQRWNECIAREELLDSQHETLKKVTEQLEKANRTPLEIIDDVLLQLELEIDPVEIAAGIRRIREDLDVKW